MKQRIPSSLGIPGADKPGSAPAAAPRRKEDPDPAKEKRVKKELKHLVEIFSDIDDNKRDFVQRHIEQLAWYYVSIADLQASVDQWGTLVPYDNGGGQSGVKTNPDIKTLMDYQKACNTIVRTLLSLVPEGNNSKHRDLDQFRLTR